MTAGKEHDGHQAENECISICEALTSCMILRSVPKRGIEIDTGEIDVSALCTAED